MIYVYMREGDGEPFHMRDGVTYEGEYTTFGMADATAMYFRLSRMRTMGHGVVAMMDDARPGTEGCLATFLTKNDMRGRRELNDFMFRHIWATKAGGWLAPDNEILKGLISSVGWNRYIASDRTGLSKDGLQRMVAGTRAVTYRFWRLLLFETGMIGLRSGDPLGFRLCRNGSLCHVDASRS